MGGAATAGEGPAGELALERRLLAESLGVAVVDFRCRAHAHGALGPEEANEAPSLVFVRRGVFERAVAGERLLADVNHVLFFKPGEPYRVAHPLPGGDDCTILSLASSAAAELAAEDAFRRGHASASPRAVRLHWELLALLRQRPPALVVDDLVAELAHEALRGGAADTPARTPAGARRRRELVEAAKLALHDDLASPPSLGALAASLRCSPFHLSRTFREVTGWPLRRYLGRLRVRAAAARLARGERDLTDLALDLGFADHSHFTNAFRRELGVPPSTFRERLAPRRPGPARRRA